MERSQAVRILASIVRNVEMDGARAQVLRGTMPAPLAEVGEALRMAYNALRGDSDGATAPGGISERVSPPGGVE